MNHTTHNNVVSFIWGIGDDVLRDVYVRGKYRVYRFLAQILPFTDTYMESVDVDSYRIEQEVTVHIMLDGDEEIGPIPPEMRTDFYRDFTNEPEVKSYIINELFRSDYDGMGGALASHH